MFSTFFDKRTFLGYVERISSSQPYLFLLILLQLMNCQKTIFFLFLFQIFYFLFLTNLKYNYFIN